MNLILIQKIIKMKRNEAIIWIVITLLSIIGIYNMNRVLEKIDPFKSRVCIVQDIFIDTTNVRTGYAIQYFYKLKDDKGRIFDKSITESTYKHAKQFKYDLYHKEIVMNLYESNIDKNSLLNGNIIRVSVFVYLLIIFIIFIIRIHPIIFPDIKKNKL